MWEEKPHLYPELCPPRLTPNTALLEISQLTAWEAVAVLAPDDSVRAGNTLYSRYCKTGKRTKQGSGRSRRENREGGDAASQGAGLVSGGGPRLCTMHPQTGFWPRLCTGSGDEVKQPGTEREGRRRSRD